MFIYFIIFLVTEVVRVNSCNIDCELCLETTNSCAKCMIGFSLIEGECEQIDQCSKEQWRQFNGECINSCNELQLWSSQSEENVCFEKVRCPEHSKEEEKIDFWQICYFYYKGMREQVEVKVIKNALKIVSKKNQVIYEYFDPDGNIVDLYFIENEKIKQSSIFWRTESQLIILFSFPNQPFLSFKIFDMKLRAGYEVLRLFAYWGDSSIKILIVSSYLNQIQIQNLIQENSEAQEFLNEKINSIKSVKKIFYLDESTLIGVGELSDFNSLITFSLNFSIQSHSSIKYTQSCTISEQQQLIEIIFMRSISQQLIYTDSQIFLSTSEGCINLLTLQHIIQITLINNLSQVIILSQNSILLFSLEDLLLSPNNITPLDEKDNNQYQLLICFNYEQNEVVCNDVNKLTIYLITISSSNTLNVKSLINLQETILQMSIDYPSIFVKTEQQTIFFPEQKSASLTLGTCYYNINYSGNSQRFEQNLNLINIFNLNDPFHDFKFHFLFITLEQDPSIYDINLLSQIKDSLVIVFQPLFLKQQLNFNQIFSLKHAIILRDFTLSIEKYYQIIFFNYFSLINVDVVLSSSDAQIEFNNQKSFSLENVSFFNISIINQPIFILNNYETIKMINVSIQNCNLFAPLIISYQVQQIFMNEIHILNSYLNNTPIIQLMETISFSLMNSNFMNNSYKNPTKTESLNSLNYGLIFHIKGVDSMNIKNIKFKQNNNIRMLDEDLFSIIKKNSDFKIRSQSKMIFHNSILESNICEMCQIVSITATTLFLSDSIFINNYSLLSNGTIYIQQAISYLQRCTFENNTAYSGGALFFNRTSSAQIVSSFVTKNNALTTGGGITFVAAIGYLNSTIIQYNTAMIGGGIRIEIFKLYSVHWDSKSIITHNIATIYGNNVISRLVKREIYFNNVKSTELGDQELALINIELLKQKSIFTLQKALFIDNIQSGQQTELLIKLYDADGKQFFYDPDLILTYPLKIQEDLNSIGGIISSQLIQIIGYFFIHVFSVKHGGYLTIMNFYGAPNQIFPLFLAENYIEFITKDSQVTRFRNLHQQIIEESTKEQYLSHNQQRISYQQSKIKRILEAMNEVQTIMTSQYMTKTGIMISFLECQQGEIQKMISIELSSAVCSPCPLGFYTFSNKDLFCKKCPDSAEICENNTIILKDGYWRHNKTSDEIYPCSIQSDKCQEYSQRDQQQQCSEGSIGPECEGCDIVGQNWNKSYTKKNSMSLCVKCNSQENQLAYIILMFIFTSIYLTLMGYISMSGNIQHSEAYYLRMMDIAPVSSSDKGVSSQLIKLLVHYLQIIAVITEISFQLPIVVNFLPTLSSHPSSALILSSACFYNQLGLNDIMKYKVIQAVIFPVLYCLSVILLWNLLKVILKKQFRLFQKQYLMSLIIFLIIFFQPDTVMFLLSAVGCRKLGGKQYLIADANYECYETQNYKSFLYSFTIPSLLIWSLSPILILFLLRRKRKNLNSVKVIKTYGYLYLEYTKNCYFFEFIRSFFKVVIVATYTLINTDKSLKLNCIILFISSYLIFSNKLKPFKNKISALIDSITHLALLFILALQSLNQNLSFDDKITYYFNIISTSFNFFFILFMITLIIFHKLKEYPQIFNLILTILKRQFGKYFTSLQSIKINTSETNIKVFKRWRSLRKNLKKIILHHANEKQKQQKKLLENHSKFQKVPINTIRLKEIQNSKFHIISSPQKQSSNQLFSPSNKSQKVEPFFHSPKFEQIEKQKIVKNEIPQNLEIREQISDKNMIYSNLSIKEFQKNINNSTHSVNQENSESIGRQIEKYATRNLQGLLSSNICCSL